MAMPHERTNSPRPSALRWCVGLLAFLLLVGSSSAQEVCDNGVDDDANGLIDLNDTIACPCTVLPPATNLIANGSFEEQTCCPGQPGIGVPNSFVDCATGWVDYQISASADIYDPCGFFPSMIPQPVPDGDAVAGIVVHTWPGGASYEFFTQCLATPMLAGQTYELGFNVAAVRMQFGFIGTNPINFGPLELAIFGLDTCPPLPYTMYDPVWGSPMPAQYCPTELGFTELGTVTYNPSNSWEPVNFTFQPPFNVGAIMIGPACPIPQDYNMWGSSEPYFFFDDFSLVNAEVMITHTGSPCTSDLVLTASPYDNPPNSYQWFLDGVALVGQTNDTLHASALGLGEGEYTMRLIRPDGSCVMALHPIEVAYPAPMASVSATSGCAPLNVQLTNNTDPALSGSVQWDLGDGNTSNDNNPLYTYTDAGVYDVRLTITSALGCTMDSLFEDLITVHPTPLASFAADTTVGCVGTEVGFTNTTTPVGNYTCNWSFGDGQIIQGECDPQHTYQSPGTYNVMIQVESEFGCQDDHTISQMIQILPVPEPAFSYSVTSGCVPLEVRFENESPDLNTQTAAWDLGNGETATTTNAITSYDTPGVYTVALTMTNTLGCSATHTVPNAISVYGIPQVTFFVEPDSGCAPLGVQFTNTTDPGMIGGCAWDFGDGATSGDCSTGHTYTQAGTFTVSLTVNSPAGCEGDTTLYHLVHVAPSPTAHFTFGPQPTDLYHPEITFQDGSSADAVSWLWHFPQGTPQTAASTSVTVRYPNENGDRYPATLTVANAHGCTDTLTVMVTIDGVHAVYAPNAFTPDGDGVNAVFLPIIRDDIAEDHDLRIFDRWGEEVFRSTDPGKGWDGTVGGAEPKTDVYVWRLLSRSQVDGVMRAYTGHVTVLR